MKKTIAVRTALTWIAENEGKRGKALAMLKVVNMLAALAGEPPSKIVAEVARIRRRKRRVTGKVAQEAAFAFIERFSGKNGMAPTYQEIAEALSLNSASTAFVVVGKLAERGRVKLPTKQRYRGIEIVRPQNAQKLF